MRIRVSYAAFVLSGVSSQLHCGDVQNGRFQIHLLASAPLIHKSLPDHIHSLLWLALGGRATVQDDSTTFLAGTAKVYVLPEQFWKSPLKVNRLRAPTARYPNREPHSKQWEDNLRPANTSRI